MQEPSRAAVDAAIDGREWSRALALLQRHFRSAPSIGSAQFTIDRMRRIEDPRSRTPMRVAILRSFTVEPVVPLLRAAALLHGLELEVWVGGFGTYAQELLDASRGTAGFGPDAVILAVQTRDLAPELWDRSDELEPGAAAAVAEEAVQRLSDWIAAFRSRSTAHVVVQGFELPDQPAPGLLDSQAPAGQAEAVRAINRGLVTLAAQVPGLYLLDYDGLVARHGRRRWHDESKWLTARMPIAADCLAALADEYLRLLLPLSGRTAKAVVVDLDNTMWGGVVGEDGLEGLQLGPEHPGAAHVATQRALRALARRGLLLAIASKNNEAEALEALDRHPAMLLRSGDFAALRINWNDKAQSLREIAEELGIGVDALALVDDSPAERERVRLDLPEVTVVELPADPLGHARAILDCPAFERLALTDEDRRRGRLYAEQGHRASLQRRSASVEDFLRSLQMEVAVAEADLDSVPRVAQLTQKTNQFNLTTRRYGDQEILALVEDAGAHVYQVRVRDRFGDSGLVGVAITRAAGEAWEIDTLLLSCRVIGRAVETALLARLCDDARAAGVSRMVGWFLPTKKNAPAREFYAAHGFCLAESSDGATRWEADLRSTEVRTPDWIAEMRGRAGLPSSGTPPVAGGVGAGAALPAPPPDLPREGGGTPN